MTHLGDRVTTLVDGQLSVEATERAHVHLAGCRDCREVAEAERLIKGKLATLSDPEPGIDLMGRLLAMGGPSGPLPPRAGHVPGSPRSASPRWQPVAVASGRPSGRQATRPDRPPARPISRVSVRRRRARLAGAVLGALGVVGAGVGGLAMGPPPAAVSGSVNSSSDSLIVDRGPSASRLPFPEQQSSGVRIESVLATSHALRGRN